MTKKPIFFLILVMIALLGPSLLFCQGPADSPSNTLESGDRAVVSGDYVRVRSGPSLEHRILTKVNSGAEATVLARGDKPQKIGDSTNYWYQVKLDAQDLSGWIYGAFLRKRETAQKEAENKNAEMPALSSSTALQPSPAQQVELKEIGEIDEGSSQITSGDLDQNGKPELLFLAKDGGGRTFVLNGYEKAPSGFSRVYSVNMRSARIRRVEVLSTKSLEYSILAAYSAEERGPAGRDTAGRRTTTGQRSLSRNYAQAPFTSIFIYDAGRGLLRPVSRLNTPELALGTLDGRNPYFVYLRKNKYADSDGTVTYTLETVRVETRGGRISLKESYRYAKPLPVKKLTLFDLNGDGRDEIIAEIGGVDKGGGIAILELRDGSIARLINSGIPTYNDSEFLALWGAKVEGKPHLVVYSTDPSGANDENSEFGFVLASLYEGTLNVDRFYPVNKMRDEVNNGRRIVHYVETAEGSNGQNFPFLIVDSGGESNRSTVKKAVL